MFFKWIHFQLYRVKKKVIKYLTKAFWEKDIDNLYYGHYNIMKNYAKVKLPYKINGEMQHGWNHNNGIPGHISLHTNQSKKKRYYLWNDKNLKQAMKDGFQNILCIGAPFIYLYDNYNHEKEVFSNSLILFPLHSVKGERYFDIVKSYRNYLKQIKNIANRFQKISVSLYWDDYLNKDVVDLFINQNINVYCMGLREKEPNFLKNFIDIVGSYEYVSSDSYSSAIFYSLYMRKKVFLYGKSMLPELNIGSNDQSFRSESKNNIPKIYPKLNWINFDDKCHYEIAEKELGVMHKKTPKEIKQIFGWSLSKTIMSLLS